MEYSPGLMNILKRDIHSWIALKQRWLPIFHAGGPGNTSASSTWKKVFSPWNVRRHGAVFLKDTWYLLLSRPQVLSYFQNLFQLCAQQWELDKSESAPEILSLYLKNTLLSSIPRKEIQNQLNLPAKGKQKPNSQLQVLITVLWAVIQVSWKPCWKHWGITFLPRWQRDLRIKKSTICHISEASIVQKGYQRCDSFSLQKNTPSVRFTC